jgi:hypothetical protein
VAEAKEAIKQESVKYMTWGYEVGEEEKTPHLQGFVSFKDSKKFSATKDWFRVIGFNGAHIEEMRGTTTEAITYCHKGGDYYEHGIKPLERKNASSGGEIAAARYTANIKLCKEHKWNELEEQDPVWFVQNINKLELIGNFVGQPVTDLEKPTGFWITGTPGSGKSYFARRFAERQQWKLYLKQNNKWWDNYSGEACVLIEDIDPSWGTWAVQNIKLWVDQYAVRVEKKGGNMVIRPKCIIFTSNYCIDCVFANGTQHDRDAIRRRMRVVIEDFSRERVDSYFNYEW